MGCLMEPVRIVSDPGIMLGKPVIAGTRITVELLLKKLAAGESTDQIKRAHPHLPAGGIEAALAYSSTCATLEQMSEELALLATLRRAEAAADAGQVVPHDEVERKSAAWTSA